jgi:molybdenum cofactor biosynthesis protein B
VVTVSDTRTPVTDDSGRYLRGVLERAGHEVTDYRIVRDEVAVIRAHLRALRRRGRVRVVVMTGGTGLTPRDRTFEAVDGLFDKRLDGFGELFRSLSWRRIGSAAMLSRAVAGTIGRMAVFSVPGSAAAVRLAATRLILPEIGHIAALLEGSAGRAR